MLSLMDLNSPDEEISLNSNSCLLFRRCEYDTVKKIDKCIVSSDTVKTNIDNRERMDEMI